jgi:hypothetical protein
VRGWIILCGIMVLCASGCVENRQYFRPTEHLFGETPRGESEAIYQLVGPIGPFGEAKVWSAGAFREQGRTVLHASLEVHNTSGVAIEIDAKEMHLDPVRAGKRLLREIPSLPSPVVGIAPGQSGHVELRFVLPGDIRPGHVSGFGLRWEVKNGPQAYTMLTRFAEDRSRFASEYPPTYGYGYGVYCTPFDPFCERGAYGWGAVGRPIIGPPPAPEPGGREVIRVR